MKADSTVAGNTRDGLLRWLGGGTFEGSVRLVNGRFDRRRFIVEDDAKKMSNARREWEAWKSEVRREERAKMRNRARGLDDRDRGVNEKNRPELRKEVDMASPRTTQEKSETSKSDTTFVVMVVGGAPVFVIEDFEQAISVCDALVAGARASGFAAKYDVVEVKKWSV